MTMPSFPNVPDGEHRIQLNKDLNPDVWQARWVSDDGLVSVGLTKIDDFTMKADISDATLEPQLQIREEKLILRNGAFGKRSAGLRAGLNTGAKPTAIGNVEGKSIGDTQDPPQRPKNTPVQTATLSHGIRLTMYDDLVDFGTGPVESEIILLYERYTPTGERDMSRWLHAFRL